MAYLPAKKIAIAVAVTYDPKRSTTRAITATKPTRCSAASPPSSPPTTPRRCLRNNLSHGAQVLFIYNEHLATEGLLGEAFTECGYDVDTFEVVPADRVDDPAGDVTFPDPTGYDVIVPLGARWPVYDEALRRTWVGAEMQMCATPPTPAYRPSACASAASCWRRRSAGRWRGRRSPRSAGTTSTSDDES